MTAQFHEGQEVEVAQQVRRNPRQTGMVIPDFKWRKAKVVRRFDEMPQRYADAYIVEFRHGSCAVIDAEHIRATTPAITGRIIEIIEDRGLVHTIREFPDISHCPDDEP